MSKSNPDLFLYQRLSGKYPEIFRAFEEVARAFKLLPAGTVDSLKGAWDAGTTYGIGDTITYGGSTYIAVARNQGRTPSSTSDYWSVLAEGASGGVFDGITIERTAAASAGETIITAGVTDAAGRVYLKNDSAVDAEFAPLVEVVSTGSFDGTNRPFTIKVKGDIDASSTVPVFRVDVMKADGTAVDSDDAYLFEIANAGDPAFRFRPGPSGSPHYPFLHIDKGGSGAAPNSSTVSNGTYLLFGQYPSSGMRGIGEYSSHLWFSVNSSWGYYWYVDTTVKMELTSLGVLKPDKITLGIGSGPKILYGTGSPEGVETAGIGSLFLRTDGGAGTSMYVKESGTGNTGWAAK